MDENTQSVLPSNAQAYRLVGLLIGLLFGVASYFVVLPSSYAVFAVLAFTVADLNTAPSAYMVPISMMSGSLPVVAGWQIGRRHRGRWMGLLVKLFVRLTLLLLPMGIAAFGVTALILLS